MQPDLQPIPVPKPGATPRPAPAPDPQPTPSPVRVAGEPASVSAEFARAENEDDDGYDPWSDRRPAAEPLFEADPWN